MADNLQARLIGAARRWVDAEGDYEIHSTPGSAEHLAAAENSFRTMVSEHLTPAAVSVLAERQRHVTGEGWTPEHDDQHEHGEMALAAASYAVAEDMAEHYNDCSAPPFWPWSLEWWKPKTYRKNLVRAAALLLAEIERIDRRDASAAAAGVPERAL